MKWETITSKNVQGKEYYHIKVSNGNLEPVYIKIGEKNYKKLKELEKQPELPINENT